MYSQTGEGNLLPCLAHYTVDITLQTLTAVDFHEPSLCQDIHQ